MGLEEYRNFIKHRKRTYFSTETAPIDHEPTKRLCGCGAEFEYSGNGRPRKYCNKCLRTVIKGLKKVYQHLYYLRVTKLKRALIKKPTPQRKGE